MSKKGHSGTSEWHFLNVQEHFEVRKKEENSVGMDELYVQEDRCKV